jgi:DNA repair protein RadC
MRAEYSKNGLPDEPHKQLEMLLFHVRPRVNTNEIAHRLIKRFGSLHGVLEAQPRQLKETEGVGAATAEFLSIVGYIAQEYNAKPPVKRGALLDTPERADAYIRKRLGRRKSECILVAYLDAKKRLILDRMTADTALSSARVENSLRVTVGLALQCNAANVLVGHNHPGGNPMPSKRDIAEASRLKEALRIVGVGLADFVIVGEDGETYSPVRGGLLL